MTGCKKSDRQSTIIESQDIIANSQIKKPSKTIESQDIIANSHTKKPSTTIKSQDIIANSHTKIPSFIGKEWGKKVLDKYLTDTSANLLRNSILIQDTSTLISIAEPILFDIYGKNHIINEKPYEIYLYGDYWLMMGTLPIGWEGGTFSIVINRKTCEVMGISHGK